VESKEIEIALILTFYGKNITVSTGGDRPDRGLPHAVFVPGKFRGALHQSRDIGTLQPDAVGIWCQDPEHNLPVRQHLGRIYRRSSWKPGLFFLRKDA